MRDEPVERPAPAAGRDDKAVDHLSVGDIEPGVLERSYERGDVIRKHLIVVVEEHRVFAGRGAQAGVARTPRAAIGRVRQQPGSRKPATTGATSVPASFTTTISIAGYVCRAIDASVSPNKPGRLNVGTTIDTSGAEIPLQTRGGGGRQRTRFRARPDLRCAGGERRRDRTENAAPVPRFVEGDAAHGFGGPAGRTTRPADISSVRASARRPGRWPSRRR